MTRILNLATPRSSRKLAFRDQLGALGSLRLASRPQPRLVSVAWLVIAFLSTVGATLAAEPADDEAPAAKAVEERQMVVRVIDPDGNPLKGVSVFRNHVYKPRGRDRPQVENKKFWTDANGKAFVTLAGSSVDLRLWVRHGGFVPLHAMWSRRLQSDGDRIPDKFTFQFARGTVIGGVVRNETGAPIAGVRVSVVDPTAKKFHTVNPNEPGQRPVRLTDVASAVTGPDGRWQLDTVPADRDLRFASATEARAIFTRTGMVRPTFLLRFTHPDYVKNEFGEYQRAQRVTHDALRRAEAAVVMKQKASTGEE